MDFLSKIIETKRQRLSAAKARVPLERIRELANHARADLGEHRLADALHSYSGMNVIAEFKRRSPSKGKINERAEPAAIAAIYESAGAAAISVLTEEDYFDGSLDDLRQVRVATQLPILRKDFIFDEYQIYESAAAGADALLLIVAALDDETLTKLRELTEDELGMDALVEVHRKPEMDRALNCGARLIGVNNRDLRTFAVSTDVSYLLARVAAHKATLVSESGLTPEEARKLRDVGYQGFLVGESLMRADDPAAKLREFVSLQNSQVSRKVWVKICGITNLEDAHAAVDAGADMLGFNFYPPSPRFIEPQAAREIIDQIREDAGQKSISIVGVFVDESSANVTRIAEEASLDGLQLHGDETVEYFHRVKKSRPSQFLIKAFPSTSSVQPSALRKYAADAVMIDAADPNLRGGTGKVADWNIARQIAAKFPRVFLAGGLTPDNVAEAIAIVQPYAVDACSSLESSRGKKDAQRMKSFVDAVRNSKLKCEASIAVEGK